MWWWWWMTTSHMVIVMNISQDGNDSESSSTDGSLWFRWPCWCSIAELMTVVFIPYKRHAALTHDNKSQSKSKHMQKTVLIWCPLKQTQRKEKHIDKVTNLCFSICYFFCSTALINKLTLRRQEVSWLNGAHTIVFSTLISQQHSGPQKISI